VLRSRSTVHLESGRGFNLGRKAATIIDPQDRGPILEKDRGRLFLLLLLTMIGVCQEGWHAVGVEPQKRSSVKFVGQALIA
jgi:hypothetical protein